MTDNEGWERQPGGLWLKVSPYDKDSPQHQALAQSTMRDTVGTVSATHGAPLDEKAIRQNLMLLNEADEDDPDIILEFLHAKWDVCEQKAAKANISAEPEINEQQGTLIGGATGWLTYYYDANGKLQRSHHLEDFAVFRYGIRDLFRERELLRLKVGDLDFPEESLASCFYRMSLEGLHKKYGVIYGFGEVAPGNKAMLRQLKSNGANMGMGLDSAVLEYDRMPGGLFDLFPETVKVRPIWNKGKKSKRSFIVRWKDGDHDVRFVVTKGQATASGVPRIDIRPWDNGNPPDPYILESVVAATLRAIEEEAGKRKWNIQKRPYVPSPLIPLLESRPDIHKALFKASADRIIIPDADVSETFDPPTPSIHVHIIGKKHMIDAFKDAQRRFFGDTPMVPGVNMVASAVRLAP